MRKKTKKTELHALGVLPAPAMPVPTPAIETPQTPEEKEKAKLARRYFNANTQRAICDYQKAQSKKERDVLYTTEILPAFSKLVENLVNIHKFTALHDTPLDLKNDCVNFLFETIGKFDGTRGTNAFSYFNVVAKNWLIIRTKQKSQRMRRSVSLDDPEALSANELRIIEDHCVVPGQDQVMEEAAASANTIAMLHEIRSKVKTDNELACVNSIIAIFENVDQIDFLNKSAILLYMREMSGLSPKQLTTTMQAIKRHYRRMKLDSRFKLFG